MTIKSATSEDFKALKNIVLSTITEVYPKYYPRGAVVFFINHHSDENIIKSIIEDQVFLFFDNNVIVGTGTIAKNEIGRLFILPQFQGKGYGSKALDFLEKVVFENYNEIVLSSSFPAFELYKKRGYTPFEYHRMATDNGDYLCYFNMKLVKP